MENVHVTAVFKVYESQVQTAKRGWLFQQKIFLEKFQTVCKKIAWKSFISRISRPKVFFKKDVLENFANVIVKHVPESLFCSAWHFVGKLTPAQLFCYEFAKFLRTSFLQSTSRRLSECCNNVPRVFRTKCVKNESIYTLITYLYIYMWLNYNTSIHQTTTAWIKQIKAKPYQFTKRRL